MWRVSKSFSKQVLVIILFITSHVDCLKATASFTRIPVTHELQIPITWIFKNPILGDESLYLHKYPLNKAGMRITLNATSHPPKKTVI